MTSSGSDASISRRTALAGLSAGGFGLALATRGGTATAQEAAGDPAVHPVVGTWAVLTPGYGIVPQIHGADGSVVAAFPPNYVDPVLGFTFQGPGLGRWEATGERRAYITFIQALSDAEGTHVGTFQLGDDLELSEDGQTWSGSATGRFVLRDVGNNIIADEALPTDLTVTAVRMGATIDSLVLPVTAPAAATPTA